MKGEAWGSQEKYIIVSWLAVYLEWWTTMWGLMIKLFSLHLFAFNAKKGVSLWAYVEDLGWLCDSYDLWDEASYCF